MAKKYIIIAGLFGIIKFLTETSFPILLLENEYGQLVQYIGISNLVVQMSFGIHITNALLLRKSYGVKSHIYADNVFVIITLLQGFILYVVMYYNFSPDVLFNNDYIILLFLSFILANKFSGYQLLNARYYSDSFEQIKIYLFFIFIFILIIMSLIYRNNFTLILCIVAVISFFLITRANLNMKRQYYAPLRFFTPSKEGFTVWLSGFVYIFLITKERIFFSAKADVIVYGIIAIFMASFQFAFGILANYYFTKRSYRKLELIVYFICLIIGIFALPIVIKIYLSFVQFDIDFSNKILTLLLLCAIVGGLPLMQCFFIDIGKAYQLVYVNIFGIGIFFALLEVNNWLATQLSWILIGILSICLFVREIRREKKL